LLEACLGLSIDAAGGSVILRHPMLPSYLERADILNLAVGDSVIDLHLFRSNDHTAVTVKRRVGELEVMVVR
jgi:hypothetical protein